MINFIFSGEKQQRGTDSKFKQPKTDLSHCGIDISQLLWYDMGGLPDMKRMKFIVS